MLRLLLITPLMNIGGEELSTLTITKEMLKRGHRVYVLANEGKMTAEFINAGASIIMSEQYARNPRAIIRDAVQIKRILEKEEIHIIHSQSVLPTISSYLAIKALDKRFAKPKLIFHERGIHQYTYPMIGPLFNVMTDHVIANSDYERKKLIRCGLRRSRCTRVHNSINLVYSQDATWLAEKQKLGIKPETVVLGTVGRLVEIKGISFLLQAFKRVLGDNENLILIIVGDGPNRRLLEREAQQYGISNHVVFTGFRRDLQNLYSMFDIFLLCSLFETFGNVALEAAAYGKPVILSKVGGLPETLIDGVTGLLVPPRDVAKIAHAINYLLKDRDCAEQMGKAGQARVREYFNPHRVADEIEELYHGLIMDN